MHVVKLTHGRVARLQHFDVEPLRNRREPFRRDARRKAIHQVAPAPEVVGGARARCGAVFGQARHRALKCVRMKIRHAGQDGTTHARNTCGRLRVGRNGKQRAVRVPLQQHVAVPAFGQERVIGEKRLSGLSHVVLNCGCMLVRVATPSSRASRITRSANKRGGLAQASPLRYPSSASDCRDHRAVTPRN
jgi:hypothetical protein